MTRVDFHILSTDELEQAMEYVCRLTDKAWRAGHSILIYCNETWVNELDEKLWSLRPDAFIPHNRLDQGQAPVNISASEACGEHHDVMISLAHEQPVSFSRFNRLIEVVFEEEALKAAKREHYQFYRERGYPLENHKVGNG